MKLIRGDYGLDLGQFPDLLALGQNHRAQAIGQWLVTLGAAAWANGDDVLNLIFGEQRALVGRVAGLSALRARLAAGCFGWFGRSRGWVRGRRLRRVL